MTEAYAGLPFLPADILLPRNCDLGSWSVVACDQYTSQPEYWQRVEERVGDQPSALHLILPESKLERPDVAEQIMQINATMSRYLRENRFEPYPGSLFYVERTLSNGTVRRGLMGRVDLDQYEFEPGNQAMIRATEGTVLSRIPPRVEVRKNAPLELPHIMLLADDPQRTVIEPLGGETEFMEPVYRFELMERGGRICGWRLNREQMDRVGRALRRLARPDTYRERYGLNESAKPMLFAVGDGNHSLATAKACWEQAKKQTPPEQWDSLPARYALVELNNLHDPSLEFEPIHRVLFGVDPQTLLEELRDFFPCVRDGEQEGHRLFYAAGERSGCLTVCEPEAQLAVGTLQNFLDEFLIRHPEAKIDYVHGGSVAVRLSKEPGTIAFLLPAMEKNQLFPTVIHDGILPRKTFSMGEAQDKRFYLEARKIRP